MRRLSRVKVAMVIIVARKRSHVRAIGFYSAGPTFTRESEARMRECRAGLRRGPDGFVLAVGHSSTKGCSSGCVSAVEVAKRHLERSGRTGKVTTEKYSEQCKQQSKRKLLRNGGQ